MKIRIATTLLSFLIIGFAGAQRARADAKPSEAENTLKVFEKTDPSIQKFVQGSVGYVVFPSIGKGAFVAGAAHGSGVLFEHGKPVGEADMTQVSVGLQAGGQSYSEIVFFENQEALNDFKEGHFAMSAGVSAVALSAGAAANADYTRGVAVFTATKSGLMLEASIGGQKFSFEPYKK